MGYWIHMAVNPQPVTDVGNEPAARNWVALHQSGIIMVSHGLQVPEDTGNQPLRPGNQPQHWSSPRWGWPGATIPGYQQDVGRQIMVFDWTPNELGGYVFESYGALWPFGAATPMMATGLTGAPFGLFPLNPTSSNNGQTHYNCFQMHSANGKPFGLGGWPDGFGWLCSQEGILVDWGGPLPSLQSPPATSGYNGVLGTGANLVRDFKVDPSGTSQYFILYDNGWIHSGGAPPGGAGVHVNNAFAVSNESLPNRACRWMHVQWDEGWIISQATDGTLYPYQMADTVPPGGVVKPVPTVPDPPPWLNGANGLGAGGGYWQFGDIVPGRNPSRFYMISYDGRAIGPAITGVIQALNPTVANITTTTRPTVNWTYNEISVGVSVGGQKSYNVRVYPTSVTAAVDFVAGQNAGAIWISDRLQVVNSPGTGTDKINRNLTNGSQYVAYVRVKSAALVDTTWQASAPFTMAIPAPATPASCTAVVTGGGVTYPRLNTVTVTTNALSGPELAAGVKHQFQVSAGGGPWIDVFQASATTATSVVDPYPPTNVALQYRVRSFKNVPGQVSSPWTMSPFPLLVVPPANNQPKGWRFIDPWSPDLNNPTIVVIDVEEWSMERTEPRGEFQPLTTDAMIVTSAGVKGTIHTMTVRVLNTAEYLALWNILSLGHSLILQNVFGRQWWVRPTPGTWSILRAAPQISETTEIRDAHKVTLRLVETKPAPAP